MALESVKTILREADGKGCGVAAFNCHDLPSIAAVVETAEEMGVPAIVMLYPACDRFIPVSTFAAITRDLARKVRVPIGLHLDHCEDFDYMVSAMREGFTSVIMDASKYDYEKNVRMTAEIVRTARPLGVDVEAEIGFVGSGANVSDYNDESKYTSPEEAARFVADTGVDSLAVAIGNGHGHYAVRPNLAIDRLHAIDRAVSVPLVLHGGSGIPDDQLQAAVENGMVKFNFGTNYGAAIAQGMLDYCANGGQANTFAILGAGKAAGKAFVEGRMRVLNPKGIRVV